MRRIILDHVGYLETATERLDAKVDRSRDGPLRWTFVVSHCLLAANGSSWWPPDTAA